MNFLCPICNGLKKLEKNCVLCNKALKDLGRIEDYYSPYSPYEELDQIPCLQESSLYCIHFLKCKNCNFVKKHYISLQQI